MKLVPILSLALVVALAVVACAPQGGQNSTSTLGQNPGRMFRGNRTQINAQAIAACDGKAENDSCAITTPRGNITGLCMRNETNTTLRCRFQRNETRPFGMNSTTDNTTGNGGAP